MSNQHPEGPDTRERDPHDAGTTPIEPTHPVAPTPPASSTAPGGSAYTYQPVAALPPGRAAKVWSLRTVAAAAITAVALSAAGGAALAAAGSSESSGGTGRGGFGGPPGTNGQLHRQFNGGTTGQQGGTQGGTTQQPLNGNVPGQPPPGTAG